MVFRATHVGDDPLDYFLQPSNEESHLGISDILLRHNHSHGGVFRAMIRLATNSKWTHSALLYLVSDPSRGFENTFLVEAVTKGIRVTSWRNEVIPEKQFTVGIKRPCMDWYKETPYEASRHDARDPKDTHAIAYLRHVRGIAIDQINGLYDRKTVLELSALYAERVAKRHLGAVPQIAEAAAKAADLFRKWDEADMEAHHVLRFMCSGLIQYSFFAALRFRLIKDLAIPEHREAALSNLSNMQRIIFCADLEGIIPRYIQQIQSGQLDIAEPVPSDVLDLLKTALPADFNNSPNLEWRYIILKGAIWEIHEAPEGYQPEDEDEANLLELLDEEHRS